MPAHVQNILMTYSRLAKKNILSMTVVADHRPGYNPMRQKNALLYDLLWLESELKKDKNDKKVD